MALHRAGCSRAGEAQAGRMGATSLDAPFGGVDWIGTGDREASLPSRSSRDQKELETARLRSPSFGEAPAWRRPCPAPVAETLRTRLRPTARQPSLASLR